MLAEPISCHRLIRILERNDFIDYTYSDNHKCSIDVKLNTMYTYFINYFTKRPDLPTEEFSESLFSTMSLEVRPEENEIFIEFPVPKESMCLLFENIDFTNIASNREIKVHFWEVNHIHILVWQNDINNFLSSLSEFYDEVDELINKR